MKRNKNSNGITLIALVITIIVLLILAGVSIATLTGQNGLLTKASTAGEETKKAEYKEVLELIGNELKPEQILEQLDTKEFMNRYESKIREKTKKGDSLEGATVERTNDTTIRVTTKEGYVYQITENEVKYLGKYGENTPPNLQETDIDFNLKPSGYTIGNVEVEIVPKINIEGYILQYSTDGEIWTNYTEKIIFKENGTIYATLVNEIGETGGVATKVIDTIDKDMPNEAEITFNKSSLSAGEELTATVIQSDIGNSGLDIINCEYIFTTTSTEIGTNLSSYTRVKFANETQTLTLNTKQIGTYYLHVLSVDKAGNRRETISKAVTIKDTTLPNDATITFSKTTATVGDNITATVTQSDGQSGVDIANCKYVFNTTQTAIGTSNISQYSEGGFTTETNDKVTIPCSSSGIYYLHVLTVDRAGNKKETISKAVNVTTYNYVLCSKGLFNRKPDIDYHNGLYSSCLQSINGGRYHEIKLHQGEKQVTAAAWKIKRVGTSATINYNFSVTGGNSNARPCYFFACNTPPTKGQSLSGPYATFLNSIYFSSKSSDKIPYQGTLEISGMKEEFYVGFMICDQGYGNGSLGYIDFDFFAGTGALSITFK